MADPSSTNPEPRKSTLRLVLTNSFGDITDITKDLYGCGIADVYNALREALAGCGFIQDTIDEWLPNE